MSRSSGAPIKGSLEILVLVGAIFYFAKFIQWNADSTVSLRLWFTDTSVAYSAAYPVVASFLAGIVLAYFVSAVGSIRRFSELRRARKEVVALQAELNGLRGSALATKVPPAKPTPSIETVGAKR